MAEITEERMYEALGLEAPSEEPEQSGTEDISESETEPAAEESAEAEDQSGSETAGDEQNPEQRHANAARRRQQEQEKRRQEQQAAIDEAVRQAVAKEKEAQQKQIENIFERAGLTNSYTKEPIKTAADFDAWHKTHEDRKLQQALKRGELTQDALNEAINRNPTVAAMAESAAEQRQREQAAAQAENQARIQAELAEISKLNPAIQSVTDLTTMPRAKEFYQKVQKGMTFLEAYRLVHWDELQSQMADAARTQARSNQRGKEHLNSTPSGRGQGASTVPRDEMAMFRVFNPKASAEEIQKFYNKYNNK